VRSRSGRHPSASLAVFLSFLWPGWGQWYLGRPRAAIGQAALAAIATLIVAFAFRDGLQALAARLFVPSFSLSLLGLVGVLAFLRVFSMVDAWRRVVPLGRAGRSRATAVLAPLVAVILASHGAAAYLTWAFYDAGSRIFVGQAPPAAAPSTPSPPQASGRIPPTIAPVDDFLATPDATPENEKARITILFTGIDSGADRQHALTDTLLIVSIDPETGQVAMVSFPRDIAEFPLYDGRTYTGKINSLMTSARLYPKLYPDGPLPTLTKELGYLLGVPINYFAAVNLDGFREMIDLVGGVDVVNPRTISDPYYDWLDGKHWGFYLKAGPVHLDGRTALAFVRSRMGAGDNDFTRAARQQLLLLALRDELLHPAMITKLPSILDAASRTVRTNFPSERLEEMVALADDVREEDIRRFVLGPPYSYHPPTRSTGGTYILRLYMDKLAALSVELFGEDSRYYTGPTAGP